MAANEIYFDSEPIRRERRVGNNVAPGTPVIVQDGPGFTFTGSADFVKTRTVTAGNTTTTTSVTGGGVGLSGPDYATVTFSGTHSYPVTGSSLTNAYDADGNGKPVYLVPNTTELTLTETGNTFFGVVDFFRGEDSATDTAIKIGVTR